MSEVDIDAITVQLLNAFFYSSILFLIASGLSLIYGIMRILNLAHGSLYMLGAYVAYTTVVLLFGASWWSFIIAYILALVIVAFIGIVMERGLIKPLYDKPEELQLLLTFGLILVLDDMVKMIWGPEYRGFPKLWGYSLPIGRYYIPSYFLVTIIIALLIASLLWFFFSRTTLGKQIRATAHNREVASALGINVDRVFIVAFSLGAGLSGLAGSIAGPIYTAFPGMGIEAIVMSFAVIVIGGMGSIMGSLIGSIIVGISRTLMIAIYPMLEIALVYVVMAFILLIKPIGLFGREEIERR